MHGGGFGESKLFKFLEYLSRNEEAPRDEIAAYIDLDPRTVSDKARFLKGLQLLMSDKDGYGFTTRGVRFIRRWNEERRQAP